MSITLRNIKGSELTFGEVDENFKSFFYTASLDSNILKLTYFNPPNDVTQEINLTPILGDTGSFFVNATVNKNNITFTRGDGNTLTKTIQIFPFDGDAEITGSLTVTKNLFISASENSTIQNIALYDTASGELFYTASSAVGGGGGSGATLSQELQPNLTVGGVDSSDTFAQGSTIEALLRTMLITYQEPSLINLRIIDQFGNVFNNSVRDVGASFTCDRVKFNAGVDSPNGDFPQSSSLSCTGADIPDFTQDGPDDVQATNNEIIFGNKTISKSIFGSVSFTVTTDSRTTVETQSIGKSFPFQWRNYLAASSTVISSDADLQNVLDNDVVVNQFDTNISWIAICGTENENTSNFTYIIYPSSGDSKGGYGTISNIIYNGALSIFDGTSGAFTYLGTFTANNNQAISKEWRVYKSNAPGAFIDGDKLTIT